MRLYGIPIKNDLVRSRKHTRRMRARCSRARVDETRAVATCGRLPPACKEHPMLDIAMLAIGLGFFALSVGYVLACDRL